MLHLPGAADGEQWPATTGDRAPILLPRVSPHVPAGPGAVLLGRQLALPHLPPLPCLLPEENSSKLNFMVREKLRHSGTMSTLTSNKLWGFGLSAAVQFVF